MKFVSPNGYMFVYTHMSNVSGMLWILCDMRMLDVGVGHPRRSRDTSSSKTSRAPSRGAQNELSYNVLPYNHWCKTGLPPITDSFWDLH